MNRCGCSRASLVSALFALASLAVVGCGKDDFSDEAYGFIDLSPYFYDGSTAANPIAGLSQNIVPSRGWNTGCRSWNGADCADPVKLNNGIRTEGLRAEYYDFGLVGISRKRDSKGATLAEPDYAYTSPMYFFYDSNKNPMFSKPAFDKRTGLWWMKGGPGLLGPNPPVPGGADAKKAYYSVPYSVRVRSPLMDGTRHTNDYQRPIINRLQDDSRYSGLWEVIEAVAQDSGYTPDAIKSEGTLLAAVDAGKFKLNHTGKVISCPVLDDRTAVTPSVMAYNIPRPRIELWYRTKLGTCLLANGYETIARTVTDGSGAEMDTREMGAIELLKAGSTARVNTFDVIEFKIGDQPYPTLVVPVVKMYTPRMSIAGTTSMIRFAGDDLSTTLPRHTEADPPGYSPIVWSWEIGVPQDPPYVPGTYKSLSAVDPSVLLPRTGGPWTRHYAVIGVARTCFGGDADCAGLGGLTCNRMPDVNLATNSPATGKNLADMVIEREGGPRCDAPAVGYGDFCAPGVSRCESQAPTIPTNLASAGATESCGADAAEHDPCILTLNGQDVNGRCEHPGGDATKPLACTGNEGLLKNIKVASAGPTFTAYADLDKATADVPKKMMDVTMKQMALDALMAPAMPPPPPAMETPEIVKARADLAAAQMALKSANDTVTSRTAAVTKYKKWGFTTDFGGLGYQCHPATGGGYCYVRCDGTASTTAGSYKDKLKVPDPRDSSGKTTLTEDHEFPTDSRCGGDNLVGYKCMPAGGGTSKRNVCLRDCKTQNTDNHNRLACDYKLNLQAHGDAIPFRMSSDAPGIPEHKTQQCYTNAGVTGCQWNPDFEPRNPEAWDNLKQ